MTPTRVVFTPVGSGGDLLPVLAIGHALRRRGIPVLVAAPSTLRLAIRAEGFAYAPVGRAQSDGDVRAGRFHSAARGGLDSFVQFLGSQAEQIEPAVDKALAMLEPGDLVVGHQVNQWFSIAAAVAGCETAALAYLHVLREKPDAAAFGVGPATWGDMWRALEEIDATVNRSRRRWGLAEMERAALRAPVSHRVVWMAEPRICDIPGGLSYPYFDRPKTWRGDPRLDSFLAERDRSRPMIVATLGTSRFSEVAAIEASIDEVATRCDFDLVALGMQTRVGFSTPFAPVSALLPDAAVLIHHGGFGTCVAGLRSGVPAVIVPRSYDQPVNGRMLSDAGVATVVPWSNVGPSPLETAITGALELRVPPSGILEPEHDAEALAAALLGESVGAAAPHGLR